MPAPRARAAKTQSTPAPVPVPWVGVTGVQLAPAPPHPSPDPAFQALAQSLVKLADLFPAEAPGLLAQGAALPPSSAQSVVQPSAQSPTVQSASLQSSHMLILSDKLKALLEDGRVVVGRGLTEG